MEVTRLHDESPSILKINAPTSFGVLDLGPAIAEFMTRYPNLKVELALTDRFIDPVELGVNITIRLDMLKDSNLIARKLAPAHRVLVAAPSYLK